jgi:ABC-type polysaccharide/polyol phosphate export permease
MVNKSIYLELKAIYSNWIVWFSLASQDIKLRYRRSMLGPFWITISMGVTIYSMVFLYGNLFHIELSKYLPYLATGIIGWSFISTLILESSQVFIESEGFIRNQESFVSIFLMRLIYRNVLVLGHNLLTFIPILVFFKFGLGIKTLLLIPGVLIIGLNIFCFGTVLAIISTRYRDFAQIIASFIQVSFFLTPVMWMPGALSENNQWIVNYNPFNHFLSLIRCPLLQTNISTIGLEIIIAITLIGFVMYSFMLNKYKYKVVFWL